jgi:hypothetical protein
MFPENCYATENVFLGTAMLKRWLLSYCFATKNVLYKLDHTFLYKLDHKFSGCDVTAKRDGSDELVVFSVVSMLMLCFIRNKKKLTMLIQVSSLKLDHTGFDNKCSVCSLSVCNVLQGKGSFAYALFTNVI